MARPMIIIGIGTSGLRVLENVQRFHFESCKVSKPDYVEYIYLETNKDNYPEANSNNSIRRIYISLSQMERMVKDLKVQTGAKWLPPSEQLINAGMGAGGIRSAGRLALWGENDEVNSNFRNVYENLRNAYQNVASHTQNIKDSKPIIYIVGSLTGGTGSGVFIDMAYIMREIIPDTKDVYGLFLLPSKPVVMNGEEMKYANTYAALKDLEDFNSTNTIYKEKWPSAKSVSYSQPPFELSQFISQDYQDGSPAIKTLPGLYKMAGLYLFLNIVGMHEKRYERLVDASGNKIIDKYGTFGLSGIQFPKDQIEEFVASQLSLELLERWIDPNIFILNNEKKQIIPALILQNAQKRWDEFLKDAFNSLNVVGNRDLISDIMTDAIKMNRNEISESESDYLKRKFGSNHTDGYYRIVRDNIQTAVDVIVDKLHDLNVDVLNKNESLSLSQITLQSFADTIDKTLKYWQSIGLSSKTENWDNFLRVQIEKITNNKFKNVLEQDQVVKDRMATTFELLKMHLMISKLIDIKNSITKEDAVYRASISSKELPKTKYFDNYIKIVRQVIGSVDNELNQTNIGKRMNEIKQDVEDETIPILRIFPSGTFANETANAKNTYRQKNNQNVPSCKDITKQDLWSFFHENNFDLHNRLLNSSINSFKDLISAKNCVMDYNVSEYISRHGDKAKQMAQRGLSGFISLNKTLTTSSYLPRFIAGSDKSEINGVINILESQNFTEFKKDDNNILAIPEIKNIMVFFDEKGGFIPTIDLTYIDQMKEVYDNKPLSINDSEESWKQNRKAYIVEQKEVKNENPEKTTTKAKSK